MSRFLTAIALTAFAVPVHASDVDATRADIEKTLGRVPTFISQVANSALPGLWQQTKALEFSTDTALDPKTKALISLGVSAQIPCSYCIWMDTNSARSAGATDQEIAEAVAISGLSRNWSTVFNGLQVDLAQFKTELGGN
jgi:AhpD family alkylhydroperoxidase